MSRDVPSYGIGEEFEVRRTFTVHLTTNQPAVVSE